MTDEMIAAILCEKYGWTWQEYQEQPSHFIDTILSMLRAEAKQSRK